jgi:hypothetical protein
MKELTMLSALRQAGIVVALALLAACTGTIPPESGSSTGPRQQADSLLKRPPRMHWRDGGPHKIHAPSASLALGDHLILSSVFGHLIGYNMRSGEEDFRMNLGVRATHFSLAGKTVVVGTKPIQELEPRGLTAIEFPRRIRRWDRLYPEFTISALLQDSESTVLVATSNGYLRVLDVPTGEFRKSEKIMEPHEFRRMALFRIPRGIWGVIEEALLLLDPETLRVKHRIAAGVALPGTPQGLRYRFGHSVSTPHGLLVVRQEVLGEGIFQVLFVPYTDPAAIKVLGADSSEYPYLMHATDIAMVSYGRRVRAWSLPEGGPLWDRHIPDILPFGAIVHGGLLFQPGQIGIHVLDPHSGIVVTTLRYPGSMVGLLIDHPLGMVALGNRGETTLFTFKQF